MPTRSDSTDACSPARHAIPGLNFVTSPVRNRHLDGAISAGACCDSPPRKLGAGLSSTGSGAPSPRRKQRRGKGKKGGGGNITVDVPVDPNSSITRFFPSSPIKPTRDADRAIAPRGRSKKASDSNEGVAIVNDSSTKCDVGGDSTETAANGIAKGTTTTPRGKKKKRRRKKSVLPSTKTRDAAPAAATLLDASGEDPKRQSQLTEFYPVRRSDRRPKSLKEKEERESIAAKILGADDEGLDVRDILGKGRGVLATKDFKRGDFIVEYDGDLISFEKAKERESIYRQNPSIGCYMYYFSFRERKYCVDATSESGKLGRLINHSTKTPNLTTRLFPIGDVPHLIFVAARDIRLGEELMYDYGDRSREATEAHPWLKT